MSDTIHLDPAMVPASLRGNYSGRKFQARVTESVTIPADAGLWDGGSQTTYAMVRLSDGAGVAFPGQASAPWDGARQDRTVALQPGFAVVRHSTFRGKDMGLVFYIHTADAAPMLPAPVELSPLERVVLEYTATRKSSYIGQDRCAMAIHDQKHGYGYFMQHSDVLQFTREMWDSAKQFLIARGYLNKAGAITTAGRNAR